MPKKSDTLSARQRQSQQIMRDKAARKRRKTLLRRATIVFGGLFFIAGAGAGIWAWKTSAVSRAAQAVSDAAWGATARAGFALKDIYLEGRSRTSMEEIQHALGIQKGEPILRLSLEETRQRLEQVESVKLAAVERALPGTLYVRIVEREPVALWQNEGRIALVDDKGTVMRDIDSAPYMHLPLIVGNEAPQHVSELMEVLAAAPELARRFSAAIYVGERRWNIRLTGGIEIKLPENEAAQAWKRLAQLQSDQHLLDREVRVIDLRLPERLFIKIVPPEMPGKVSGAKET